MTQTLYSQFFSIFPLNLGIADFIFFSIVFAGILVIILMSNNIGSKIVRVIQAVGGTAMGVDAALNFQCSSFIINKIENFKNPWVGHRRL